MVSGFNYPLLVLWFSFWCLVIALLILVIKARQRRFRKKGLVL